MTPTEQLIASLTALDNTSYYLPGSDVYFDWSSRDDDGTINFEVGNSTDATLVEMSREDMVSLQQRLTAYLIAAA